MEALGQECRADDRGDDEQPELCQRLTTDGELDDWLGLALDFNPKAKASQKQARHK